MNNFAKALTPITAALALLLFPLLSFGADGSQLKPPPGARVAVVMFEDLECPDCARAYPLVWDVAGKYNVPVVLHDFPLQMHPWSFDAAVFARYFDTKSQKLGDDFRGYIFKNQNQIDKGNLRQYVDKFAGDNNAPIPFVLDPDGQLKAKVLADRDMGNKMSLQHTPTIFVVGNGGPATPAVEVDDRSKLGSIIEDMLKKSPATKATSKKAPAKKTAKK